MSARVFGILRVGAGDVALDAHDLQEVVRLEKLPPPRPRAPAWSRGTLSLRGQPLPLVDLAGLLQLDHAPQAAPTFDIHDAVHVDEPRARLRPASSPWWRIAARVSGCV